MLGSNDTQGGILAVLFKYCDDKELPLLDLKDLKSVIHFAQREGKEEVENSYGNMSGASLGTINRKVIALEQQSAETFFGELSFEVKDLMRFSDDGKGMINILRLMDLQSKPYLFATFMLQILGELFRTLPEVGDLEKPKLVLVIDVAHLVFKNAGKALLQVIDTTVKLISSKGVGILFCTQNPMDIPDNVLGQLCLKIQHALRAFTAKDRQAIKKTAENYPIRSFYKTDELLTQMGIEEAFITLLNEKEIPTPLVHVFLMTPRSRMDILSEAEIPEVVAKPKIAAIYNQKIDRESAFEILNKKVQRYSESIGAPTKQASDTFNKRGNKKDRPWLASMVNSSAGKQVQRSLVRTLFGVLKRALK